jgi:hypothetical protein
MTTQEEAEQKQIVTKKRVSKQKKNKKRFGGAESNKYF